MIRKFIICSICGDMVEYPEKDWIKAYIGVIYYMEGFEWEATHICPKCIKIIKKLKEDK